MSGRSPVILIVDDEEHIPILVSFILKRAGFTTITANSGTEALELWRDDIDLVIIDCAMPDLFGDELALRLLEKKKSLKILFMSGNPLPSLELMSPSEEDVNFLPKPFDLKDLPKVVRRLLPEHRPEQVQS